MTAEVMRKLEVLEEKLWEEFRALSDLPEEAPAEVRLKVLEEQYMEMKIEGNDRELAAILKKNPDYNGETVITGCGGWCPDCSLLDWCPYAREDHTPEEIEWMKVHHDYPPEV